MARKKKKEEVVETEEQPIEEVKEDMHTPTIEIDIVEAQMATTITSTDSEGADAGVNEHTSDESIWEEYARKVSHALDEIERCNLYMWAGLDWGAGRIYEMSRKEWAQYLLDMYAWSDSGFNGVEPVMPSEVKDI